MTKSRIAIIPGDPSGIGPELIAKLLQQDSVKQAVNIVLIGDRHLWERGSEQAGLPIPLNTVRESEISQAGLTHLDMQTIDPSDVKIATFTRAGGTTSLRCLDKALDLAQNGIVDGVLFGPFNKASMTLAGLDVEDEHVYVARYLGFAGYHSEINILDELMTTPVTSHIGIHAMAENITEARVLKAINLANSTLRKAGHPYPSIAVAALNPHAGDNGV